MNAAPILSIANLNKRFGGLVATNNVSLDIPPVMGAEDFAYMLEARPGAFIFLGNGESAGLHHPSYNFNDDAIVYGSSYWIRLVETQLAG